MTQARKHRGYSSQRIVADWFTVNGWPYAEPVGAGRAGSDVTGMPGIDIEVKARRGFDPLAAMREQADRAALGDLYDRVEVEIIMDDPASMSPTDTPLWDALQRAVAKPFPSVPITPQLIVGFTDARVYRDLGAIAYGAGLFSPSISAADFGARFHGHDERIDVESLELTTRLWLDVARDMLG